MLGAAGRTLRIFSLASLLSAGVGPRVVAEKPVQIAEGDVEPKHHDGTRENHQFENLRSLNFKGGNGHYTLNGIDLSKISSESILLVTPDQTCKVRVTFLKTVLIANGEPIDPRDSELIRDWSLTIPRVVQILKWRDPIGALKPVVYALLEPKKQKDPQLQEQLTLLWSADPSEIKNIGHSGFGALMRFSEPVVDIQYRAPNGARDRLLAKMFLQILYVQNGGRRMPLGSFVIVSTSSGDYEFYSVPNSLLDQIVIRSK